MRCSTRRTRWRWPFGQPWKACPGRPASTAKCWCREGSPLALPEPVGLLRRQRPIPTLGELEFAPHRTERRLLATTRGRQPGHCFAVAANDHLFALLDQIQQVGELCLRFIDADLHSLILILVKNSDQEQAVRLGLKRPLTSATAPTRTTTAALARVSHPCFACDPGNTADRSSYRSL